MLCRLRKVAIENSPLLLRWAEKELEKHGIRARFANSSAIIVVYNDAQILGAVVFHDFNGANVQMSIVTTSEKWAGKDFIKTCFDFAFNCLKVSHISVAVREDNEKSLTLVRRLGFMQEGIIRQSTMADVPKDQIVFGMLTDECRWI